jgi:fido (protein-threonine AMPylation protein)
MARPTNETIRAQEAVLLDLLGQAHPGEGLRREDLGDAYAHRMGRRLTERTLIRRLQKLTAAGRVESVGDGPSTRYRPGVPAAAERPNVETGADELYVPLSPEGTAVRDLMRRPIMARQPVGYNRAWLDSYQPGVDWLLPEPMREALHMLGRTPDPERPAGTYAREILTRLLVDLAWASSHLEGNTYTRLDTQVLIEFGHKADGKDAEEAQMILNHKRAIELIVDNIDEIGFTPPAVRAIHAALSENLLGDPADEGRERKRQVNVTGTVYVPTSIPHVIKEAFVLLLQKAAAIPDPFEQAFFVMVHLPYLQPFVDINKRTSRLAANIPLIRANLVPLSFIDVPVRAYIDGTLAVYELKRVELLRDVFMWAYKRSCAQYLVVRDATAPPDPIRLRYREALEAVVQDVVRGKVVPSPKWIDGWVRANAIRADDVDAFAARAMGILLSLSEATAMRARLRLSEYTAWRAHLAALAG